MLTLVRKAIRGAGALADLAPHLAPGCGAPLSPAAPAGSSRFHLTSATTRKGTVFKPKGKAVKHTHRRTQAVSYVAPAGGK